MGLPLTPESLGNDAASEVAPAGSAAVAGTPFRKLGNLLHAAWHQGEVWTAQGQAEESPQLVTLGSGGSWGPVTNSGVVPQAGGDENEGIGGASATSEASSSSESGHVTWQEASPLVLGSVLASALSSSVSSSAVDAAWRVSLLEESLAAAVAAAVAEAEERASRRHAQQVRRLCILHSPFVASVRLPLMQRPLS